MIKKLLLVLMALLLAITVTACGETPQSGTAADPAASTAGTAPSESAKPAVNKDEVHVPLAEGSSGEISAGKDSIHKITVVHIADNARSSNEFETPKDGNKFIAFDILVENVGTKDVSQGEWKLRGTNDFEYDQMFAPVGFDPDALSFSNLSPGAKTQGVVVFEVPADVQPKFLRFVPNMFMKSKLFFDAA